MNGSPQILFVDDSRTARKLARKILQEKYRVYTCASGDEAWDLLRTNTSIKIVFTDINMQGMDGIELLNNIRESSNSRIAMLPVIMITGASDTEAAMSDVFEQGATDFVAKPFKKMDLLTRAYSYIKLSEKVSSLEDQLGIDKLSGLYNETSMQQHAAKFLAFAQRHKTPFSIAQIEIMHFDELLESIGNKVASQIISAIADRFKTKVRKEDVVARTSTAKFAVLQPVCNQIRSEASIKRVRTDIQNIVFKLGNKSIKLELAIGVSCSNIDSTDQTVEDMMNESDQALQMALQMSREHFSIYKRPDENVSPQTNINRHNLLDSMKHFIDGEFDQINPAHLQDMNRKAIHFVEFMRKRLYANSS